MEARQARKACRNQLETIKGGYQGGDQLFKATVLPFWSKYGIKPKKMWFDFIASRTGSMILATYRKRSIGEKFILP